MKNIILVFGILWSCSFIFSDIAFSNQSLAPGLDLKWNQNLSGNSNSSPRNKYRAGTRRVVVGESGSVNAWHYDFIECMLAKDDAFDQATSICRSKGYGDYSYSGSGCRRKLFGGASYRLVFWCHNY